MLTVNQKGNIGLIKAINELYTDTVKYHCFPSFDDYSPVDLIAMDATTGETFNIQVKYRNPNHEGAYEIYAGSVVNGKRVKMNTDLIDYWAIYMADRDELVFLKSDVFDNKWTHYVRTSHLLGEDYKFVQKKLQN